MKTTIELQNGFTAELAVCGDYYKMVCNGQTIYQDSAEEDSYDEDSAEAFFNGLLEEKGERACNIIRIAIEKGMSVHSSLINEIDSIFVDAEKFIIDNTEDGDCKYDIVDFNWGGANGQQSLYWCDEHNNVCVDEWGQIVGEDEKQWDWRKVKDGKLEKIEWFEREDEDCYIVVEKCVDTDGQVWILLA